MDFATAAVFDPVATPPPRGDATATEPDAASFARHLDAQQPEAEAPQRSPASEQATEPGQAVDNESPQPVLAALVIAAAPAAPFLVQLTGASPSPAQANAPQEATPTGEAQPPQTPAPLLPQPAGAPQPQPPRQPAAKPAAAAKSAPISAPSPETPLQTQTASPPTAQPEATQSASVAPAQTQAGPSDALAALHANTEPQKIARAPKGEGVSSPEATAPAIGEARPQGPQRLEAGKQQAKSAPAQNGALGKDAVALRTVADTPAPSPQLAEAPSTPASHTQQGAAPTDAAVARAAPAAAQVGREIIRRFNGQSTQFDLRLDPPELGRVDVRLEVSRDHRVTAIVAADSPQALAELVRHARDLEQSLQAAGLELSESGLSFDLRQGGERGADAGADANNAAAPALMADETAPAQALRARPVGFERWRGVRLDVMV